MRPTWSAPGSQSIQGVNNALLVQIMNTLKAELTTQQNQLLLDHQQENAVDGGRAESIMFHHLLGQEPMVNNQSSNLVVGVDDVQAFDANQGATGTAEFKFERRTRRKKLR